MSMLRRLMLCLAFLADDQIPSARLRRKTAPTPMIGIQESLAIRDEV